MGTQRDQSSAKKRKAAASSSHRHVAASPLAKTIAKKETTPTKPARIPKARAAADTEKRLRRFRPKPPVSFKDIFERATSQRFYVLSRTRTGTSSCPEEIVEITGSTGNVYEVLISNEPRCSCPHHVKMRGATQCKHIVFVLHSVLKAREDLVYQLALLSDELREIFEGAPPLSSSAGGEEGEGKRKPVEGDCPICFEEMKVGEEEIVWCRAACGQNVHAGCFSIWAATKRQQQAASGGRVDVTCPYCRSPWEGDKDMVKKIERTGKKRNEEGYVNLAEELGISTVRDTSSYSPWWRGFRGGGYY